MKEKIHCNSCSKDITDENKYSKIGLGSWFCKNCFFEVDYMNDRDLGRNTKVTYNNKNYGKNHQT